MKVLRIVGRRESGTSLWAVPGARASYDPERDAWLVHRPERSWPVPVSGLPVRLPAVPEVPDPDNGGIWTTLVPLLGSLGIVGFAFVVRSVAYLIVAGFMVVAIVGGSLGARGATRKRAQRRRGVVRRDFAAQLAGARAEAWSAGQVQRDALRGLYPSTAGLLEAVQQQGALWERRPAHQDFAHVRLGTGRVAAARPIVLGSETAGSGAAVRAPGTTPEPDLAEEAAAAVSEAATVADAPMVIPLRRLSSIALVGPLAAGRDLAGAWLAGLAAGCAPTDLRVVALVPDQALPAWDWAKWLPHTRDPLGGDGFGRVQRSLWTEPEPFFAALRAIVGPRLEQRRRADEASGWARRPDGPAVAGEHVLILVDGYDPLALRGDPSLALLLERGAELAATTVLLMDDPTAVPSSCAARVELTADGTCTYREAGPDGRIERDVIADRIDRSAALPLARTLAPLHLADADASADIVDTVRLVELLGYESADQARPQSDALTLGDVTGVLGAGARRVWPEAAGDGSDESDDQVRTLGRGDLLATPIGIRSDGAPLVLDLKEAAEEGMGPHGVLVGATGSGKSELLRSLVTGLAARHDPELLNMVLVDFKGGATFAELERLPHTAGLITNLADDLSLADRMRESLAGELDRRQQLLREAGVESLRAYHEKRRHDPALPPLAYLLVIVDEFGELLAARPEFLEVFVAIGRLGRSLGLHLLLATQRLDEGRIRGLESHLRYRICLRTYSAGESSTVIGVPDAYELPPLPGLGYLRVDAELVRFKAATTMLPHRPVRRAGPAPATMRRFRLDQPAPVEVLPGPAWRTPELDESAPAEGSESAPAELSVLVQQLAAGSGPAARKIWLSPLPDQLNLAAVPAASDGSFSVGVGLLDDPARQRQDPLTLDLSGSGGHVACVGAPRTGKTTFLRTLVAALTARRSPADVAIHVLDLGGGSLYDLERLPHVGAVAGRHDPDTIARLVRELRAVVAERAAAFRACGATSLAELRAHPRCPELLPAPLAGEVFLLIDNLGVLRHDFPELDLELADLASTSLQFGVHVVVTSGRWLDIRPALLDVLGTRIELRINDAIDSMAGRAAANALADRPGRGLLRDGRQVQLALPPALDVAAIAEAWRGVRAPRVLPLPRRVRPVEVASLAAAAGRHLSPETGLLLGVTEFRLSPVYLDPLATGQHLLVFGDDESGRSTLLRRVVDFAAASDPSEVRLHVVDLSRSLLEYADLPHVDGYAFTSSLAEALAGELRNVLLERLPPPDLTREQLLARSWWSGPEHVLVIDDYDLTLTGAGSPFGGLAEALGYARDIGLHVVAARRVAGAARSAFEPFGQRLRELSPAALLLSGDRSEGPLIGDRAASRQPPGRGTLVRRGKPDLLVQLVLPDDETVAEFPLAVESLGALR